jgi:putative oxygen-independent coproporphyrinogen III oxidase
VEAIPLSLYVHFPWCVKKCPYCDFNSHALRGELPTREYIDALIQDLFQQLKKVPDRNIATVFMGGGTPSLIEPKEIGRLMAALESSGRLEKHAEVTLEANPGTLDETYFEDYLHAGVNRLSVGVQSFDDALLQKIGRIHNATQAGAAIQRAKQAGFERINLDLMYALPGQSLDTLRRDLEQALAQCVEHLSVYQLTIEANTEFAVRPPRLPDSDIAWQMHELVHDLLLQANYGQYEVSAYTRGAACLHNLNYWLFGDYLAIGAGAHGKLSYYDLAGELDVERFWNYRHPKAYMKAAVSGMFAEKTTQVPGAERDFEFLMNALRLREGFELETYVQHTQGDARGLLQTLQPLFDKGWLLREKDRVRTSAIGYRYLDSVLLECL